jgi:hypothetical protein
MTFKRRLLAASGRRSVGLESLIDDGLVRGQHHIGFLSS